MAITFSACSLTPRDFKPRVTVAANQCQLVSPAQPHPRSPADHQYRACRLAKCCSWHRRSPWLSSAPRSGRPRREVKRVRWRAGPSSAGSWRPPPHKPRRYERSGGPRLPLGSCCRRPICSRRRRRSARSRCPRVAERRRSRRTHSRSKNGPSARYARCPARDHSRRLGVDEKREFALILGWPETEAAGRPNYRESQPQRNYSRWVTLQDHLLELKITLHSCARPRERQNLSGPRKRDDPERRQPLYRAFLVGIADWARG
jgi:hypothetical protein